MSVTTRPKVTRDKTLTSLARTYLWSRVLIRKGSRLCVGQGTKKNATLARRLIAMRTTSSYPSLLGDDPEFQFLYSGAGGNV